MYACIVVSAYECVHIYIYILYVTLRVFGDPLGKPLWKGFVEETCGSFLLCGRLCGSFGRKSFTAKSRATFSVGLSRGCEHSG